jgi:hypothetical protein
LGNAACLAHHWTTKDTRNISGIELVVLIVRLHQVEIDVLTLHQILVLHIANTNTRVMGENILTSVITLSTHRDEPKPRLGIEPLDNSSKTRGL